MIFHPNKAAVTLTYDDALDCHLDAAMPDLEEHGLRGTFFIPTRSPAVKAWRERPAEWKAAAAGGRGHEIGNHSQFHPCSGKEPWVDPRHAAETYDLPRMERELIGASDDLAAVVGDSGPRGRTYAYPCGVDWVGPEHTSFRHITNRLFVASRCGDRRLADPATCDFSWVPSFSVTQKHRPEEMLAFVDQAIDEGKWAVFIFHGVGGGHSIYVNREFHQQLVGHIAKRRNELMCGTFIEIAQHIRKATGRAWPIA